MGYVVERDGRFYAVLYDGIDPITGRERRRWHAAGSSRADAERIAATIERERRVAKDAGACVAGVTVARFLIADWLPGKRMTVRATTYRRYEWMVEHYLIPAIGTVPLRRLRADCRRRRNSPRVRSGIPAVGSVGVLVDGVSFLLG